MVKFITNPIEQLINSTKNEKN